MLQPASNPSNGHALVFDEEPHGVEEEPHQHVRPVCHQQRQELERDHGGIEEGALTDGVCVTDVKNLGYTSVVCR